MIGIDDNIFCQNRYQVSIETWYPWYIHDISMIYPWYIHGMSMILYPWYPSNCEDRQYIRQPGQARINISEGQTACVSIPTDMSDIYHAMTYFKTFRWMGMFFSSFLIDGAWTVWRDNSNFLQEFLCAFWSLSVLGNASRSQTSSLCAFVPWHRYSLAFWRTQAWPRI